MPDFVRIVAVRVTGEEPPALAELRPPFPEVGDDAHTVSTIREVLVGAAALAPQLAVDVLYDGTADWLDRGCLSLADGMVRFAALRLSREADRFVPPDAVPAPEEPIELDTDADRFVDALEKVGTWGDPEDDDGFLTLPFAYDDPSEALAVLARVAAHAELAATRVIMIDDRPYLLTLDRERGASVEPLHVWLEDPALRAWAATELPPPGAPAKKKSRGARATFPPADPERPYTTGSARRRLDAISELLRPEVVREVDGCRITSWSDTPKPGAFGHVVAALRDPANADETMADVRCALYRGVSASAGSPEQAADLLEAALHTETEAMRVELYDLLSYLDVPKAHRALAFGFHHDSDAPARKIRAVIWRLPGAVRELVRSELLPAWRAEGPSAKLSRRVLSLLRDEVIPVEPEWLADAPVDLVAAIEATRS